MKKQLDKKVLVKEDYTFLSLRSSKPIYEGI